MGRRRLSRWEGAGGEPVKGQHGVPRTVPSGGEAGVERGTREPRGLGGLSGDLLCPAVTEALRAPGKIPGCSGTRNLHDNLSDLRAQVAANQKGIQLVGELIGQYGLDVVQAYMGHIQVGPARLGRGQLGGEVGAPAPSGRCMTAHRTFCLPGKRRAGRAGHAAGLRNLPAGPGPAPGGVCRGPHGRRLPHPPARADQPESGQAAAAGRRRRVWEARPPGCG